MVMRSPKTGAFMAHYSWARPTVTLHNIFAGKPWADVSGELDITNHTAGITATLKFSPTNFLSRTVCSKVSIALLFF